ncbi:hypothetical protein VP01_6586g1, partial [Puccinia sorghi]
QSKFSTLNITLSSKFCCLGISLRISFSLANACQKHKRGQYKNPFNYFGDHFYYMFCILGKGDLFVISVFLNF